MKTIVPHYYNDFECTANKCKHNCCIGWEIDIDDNTLEYYKSIKGDFGDRLSKSIVTEDGVSCFKMDENLRCPFLNENGLCDIMLNLGFDKVSDICNDHPRFRNFYSDRIEIGLGLSCEAVGKIILSTKEKTKFIVLEDDEELLWEEEEDFLDFRDKIFSILQNRNLPVEIRVKKMLEFAQVKLPEKSIDEWIDIFFSLEKLSDDRDILLNELKNADKDNLILPFCEKFEIWFEQLLVYFTFRHLTEGLDDGKMSQRVAFVVLSYMAIKAITAAKNNVKGHIDIEDVIEICRVYSSEVEYCPDNVEKLLDVLSE